MRKKHDCRVDDEETKPLASYRAEELEKMRVNFFGVDRGYHEARRRFVFKGNPPPRETQKLVSDVEELRTRLKPDERLGFEALTARVLAIVRRGMSTARRAFGD